MDDTTQAVNENAEVANSVTESPAVEPQATPEVTEQVEETKPISEETPTETKTESEPKKFSGAQKRIHELVDKTKSLEAEKIDLTQRIAQLTGSNQEPQGLPQMPVVEPGREYSAEDYQRQVMQSADAVVQIRLNQQRMVDRINKDANDLMTDFPELNPKSDSYDKELSEAVTDAIERAIKSDPTISVKKFGEKLMKPYKKSVTKAVAENQETVAKQVTEAAMRPATTTQPAQKSVDDMSWQEIEKQVGEVKYY